MSSRGGTIAGSEILSKTLGLPGFTQHPRWLFIEPAEQWFRGVLS